MPYSGDCRGRELSSGDWDGSGSGVDRGKMFQRSDDDGKVA